MTDSTNVFATSAFNISAMENKLVMICSCFQYFVTGESSECLMFEKKLLSTFFITLASKQQVIILSNHDEVTLATPASRILFCNLFFVWCLSRWLLL